MFFRSDFIEKDKKKIVDIHEHVLPGVDDGSKDIDESLKMLEIAERNGITDIICTPHYKEYLNPLSKEELLKAFNYLDIQKTIYGIGVELYMGNEVLCTSGSTDKSEEYFSLNNSNYLLVEFEPNVSFGKMVSELSNFRRIGFDVVLAHVERYLAISQDIKKVKELKESGVLIQVNANSIINKENKEIYKFVKKLLKKEYVDFIASDAHGDQIRTPAIGDVVDYLYKKYDESYVDKILYKNAIKYLGIKNGK